MFWFIYGKILNLIFSILHLEKANADCSSPFNLVYFTSFVYVQVFPLRDLQIFTEDELERLLCGEQDTWDVCTILLCSLVISLCMYL